MDGDKVQSAFDVEWPAEQRAAINDAVKGRTVESIEIHDASGYQFVLITFEDGFQLRIDCERIKAVDPIEPQHI
jgi:hypothetical protein